MTGNYKGYTVDTTEVQTYVYHPDYPQAVYTAPTVKEAKRFVDAYRAGQVWACQAFRASSR